MSVYIGLIGTIVGALIAGVMVHLKDQQQRNFEKEKVKRNLLLEKYELIFKELPIYSALTSKITMELMSDAGYGKKFSVDEITSEIKNTDLPMNIMFYAPELNPILKDIDTQQGIIIKSVSDFLMASSDKDAEKGEIAGNAVIASSKINQLTASAQKKLAILVQNLTDA